MGLFWKDAFVDGPICRSLHAVAIDGSSLKGCLCSQVDTLMVYVLPQKQLYSKAKTTDVHVRSHLNSAEAGASDGYIDGAMLDGGAGKGGGVAGVGGSDGFHDAHDGTPKEPLNSSF